MTLTGRRRILIASMALALASAAQAGTIAIFNTGVDGTGTPLANGTIGDPHYVLTSVPGGTTDTQILNSVGWYPIPPWLGDDAISSWIGPNNDSDADGVVGAFVYQTTFDLTGFDPSTASLAGQWSVDNEGTDILLNGASTGNTAGGFESWSAFSIGSGFIAGVNTLDFLVYNGGGPTGLRVELSGTATDPSQVPEPTSLLLFGAGFAGLAVVRRRLPKATLRIR